MKELISKELLLKNWETFFNWGIKTLPSIIFILLLSYFAAFIMLYFLRKLKTGLISRANKLETNQKEEVEKRITTLMGIIKNITRLTIWLITGMIVLKKLGIDIGPLIAGAGIVGLAVGFGAQELVRDFISGFFIILENQIRVGDVAIINGTSGLVERIGIRTIILRDLTGTVHIFQNGKINSLSNMTKHWSAIIFEIGVAYKENLDFVIEIMEKVGKELQKNEIHNSNILEPLEIFGVDKFDNSSINIKARFKTKPGSQWAIGREYRKLLKKTFDENNIEIPFPHMSIYWGEKSKPFQINYNEKNDI